MVKGIGTLNSNTYDPIKPSSTIFKVQGSVAYNSSAQAWYTACQATPTNQAAAMASNASPLNSNGGYWFCGTPGNAMYNHVMPPNSQICFTGDPRVGAFPASSRHPGGVNVLFADGSTHFIKSTINPVTWWAIGTKAGSEVISADAY